MSLVEYDSRSESSSNFELDAYDDLAVVLLVMEYKKSFISRTPCRTSKLIERMYTLEFLVGHEARCYENFIMKKEVFMNFCETLKNVGDLKYGKKVSSHEAIEMFLVIVYHN